MVVPSPSTGVSTRVMRPAAQATYEKIFSAVYVGLMVNVFLAAACAPMLLALAVVDDPFVAWPFFTVLSCLCAPALAGAFACFGRIGDEDEKPVVVRPFWSAYRRCFAQAIATWAVGAALVSILVLDAVMMAGTSFGVLLVPFFVVASALVSAVTLAIIVALADDASRPARSLLRPSIYLVARKWYLGLPALLSAVLAVVAVLAQPVLGLFLACAPLLYIAWANLRYVLAGNLPASGDSLVEQLP